MFRMAIFLRWQGGVANPEDPGALSLAIEEARRVRADVVLASDPDADRLGCALPDPQKGWDAAPDNLAINGNQIGAILCYYILTSLRDQGKLPDKGNCVQDDCYDGSH